MNLALEVKDLYNENDKTLIKETIQQRDACTHTHKTHTDIYTFIQNHIHKHKHIHTNAHI